MSVQDTLACTRCQPTEAENVHLRSALESLEQEKTDQAFELAGSRNTLRTVERQLAHVKGELTQTLQDSPQAKTITSILEFWRVTTKHERANIDHPERRKLVGKQLKVHLPDYLMQAIAGATAAPYVEFGKRYVVGKRSDIQTQLEHCIGEKPAGRVDYNVQIYRLHSGRVAHQAHALWEDYLRIQAQHEQMMHLAIGGMLAAEQGVETADLEQWLWDRQKGEVERIAALSRPKLELVRDAA